jgi:adenine deaminase
MHVLIREGSVSKDLEALLPILTERHSPFLALCTDDRNPLDIAEEGHLDHMIRSAIAGGADRLAVYRAATLSGARAFGLRDRGLVAPGWLADLVILDDLDRCAVAGVIRAGRPVDDARFAERRVVPPVGRRSVRVPTIGAGDFALPMGEGAVPVIGVQPGRIITALEWHHPTRRYGRPVADPIRDLLKVAVIERHGKHGGMGRGFVRGFGLNRGAIASTVGHDSHNLCVLGADDGDMALAVNRLAEIEGGLIVVAGGEVRAELPLPLAGLMSLEPHEVVRDQLAILRKAAKDLGTGLDEPFLQLAFLALPVIPHLKITDRGLVDVDRFALLS